MNKYWEVVLAILMGAMALAIVLVPFVGTTILWEHFYCDTMTRLAPDFDFRWEFWGGCFVQTPSGYWVDASEYRYLEGDVVTK